MAPDIAQPTAASRTAALCIGGICPELYPARMFTAADPEEALRIAREHTIDLVLLSVAGDDPLEPSLAAAQRLAGEPALVLAHIVLLHQRPLSAEEQRAAHEAGVLALVDCSAPVEVCKAALEARLRFLSRRRAALDRDQAELEQAAEAEQARQRSESRLRRITESGIIGVLYWDLGGRILDANDTFLNWVGYTREDLEAGRIDWRAMTPPRWAQADEQGVAQLLQRGTMDAFEKEFIRKDGTLLPVLITAATFEDEPGHGVTLVHDLTERKRMEESLRESEERFRTMADGLPLIVWVHGADGEQQFVNQTFCEFFNVRRDEMEGGRWQVLMHPDDADAYKEAFLACVRDRCPFHAQVRVRRGDGQWRWIESWGRPRFSASGEFLGVVGTSADITDRRAAEEALRNSEARYRLLFESNPHPMWVYDTETLRFLAVNDAAVDHYGYTREEFLAMTIADIRPREDVPRLLEAVSKLTTGTSQAKLWRHRTKDGTIIDVEITSHIMELDGRRAELILAHDVTERLRAQRDLAALNARLEAQTLELQRSNRDLQEFSHSIAHNLKEPLRGMSNYAHFLLEDEPLSEEGRDRVETIARLSTRLQDMLTALLDYSRIGRGELAFTTCTLGSVAESAVDSLGPWLAARHARVIIRPGLPEHRCDAARLEQVFTNLIVNGVKYNRSDRPTIEIGADQTGVISIRDNGIGIEPRQHKAVFSLFRRLHSRDSFGEGTGAGLAFVRAIIERHGGRIWIDSEPGRGTTVYFTLGAECAPERGG